ncbi:ComEC/Rec2 family competence protein [Mycoplasma sp. Mirounga ES2805-ORL]|nr:ComEC/Rec2 family competence protein [Mycoplasma sp. Mirounga ES2805-ORL]
MNNGKYLVTGFITKCSEKYAIIRNENNNVLFILNKYVSPTPVEEGSKVEVYGVLTSINNYHFDKYWMLSNNITYFLKKPTIFKITRTGFSIKQVIYEYSFNENYYFSKYWRLIVFGYGDSQITKNFIKLNIVHLIVVSGFHIDLIYMIFFKINYKNKRWLNWIFFILVFWYITLLKSKISALRVFIIYLFHKNFKFKYIESWLISFFVIFLINFNVLFNIGFIFSYSLSLLVYLINFLNFSKVRKQLMDILKLVLIFIFTIPLILKVNGQINIFSFLISILFVPLIELIYIFSLFLWFSPVFLNFVFYLFDTLIMFFINISFYIKLNISSWLFVDLWICLSFFWIFLILQKENKKNNIKLFSSHI